MKFLYLIITLFALVGCKTKVRNECVAKDSIVVTYYRGHYESFDDVSFVDMKQMSDRKMTDETISLDSTLFHKFKSFIKKVSRYRLSADDARFYLKVIEMKLRWAFLFIYMLHKNKRINHYVIQFIRSCGRQNTLIR